MHSHKELNERERVILQAVVHTFVTSAEPVGSRAIVRRYDLDWSAATVRNVMADLEDYGFLQQLHTSSGRVPTDAGYRYFVDYLMRIQELTLAERRRIEQELAKQLDDADEIMRQTSHLLALISHQAGIVEAPAQDQAHVRSVELMPLSAQRLAVLVADDYGRVQTAAVKLVEPVDEERLPKLRAFLNDALRGVAVNAIREEFEQLLAAHQDEERRLAEDAWSILRLLPGERPGQLFLEGAAQLFEQPEFHDVQKAREVLTILDERGRLGALLRESLRNGDARCAAVIGSELGNKSLSEVSLVAAPYYVQDKPVGMLGILGPRRMHYPRLMAVVDYTAGLLSRFMTRLAG